MSDTLALYGGRPIRKNFLKFSRPDIGQQEQKEMLDTLRSDWLTTGPKTKLFERRFAEYIGSHYAIAVNSCTAGLHLALVALGIKEGDEVVTTPITFASTANVIVHTGAKPVFVDVDPQTLNIDPEKIEKKINKRTKAIIPVHYIGQACEMDRILKISSKYNLSVIEDAAHAIETVYKGKKIGTIGQMTAFSFYATKNITTGEGGMITTNNRRLAEKIAILSLHGISRDAWRRYSEHGYKHWEILYPGYKYNMFDLQASLGLGQLKKINYFWRRRREIVKMYNQALNDVKELQLLYNKNPLKGSKDAYHLYPVIVRTEDVTASRDTILNALQAENIGVGVHFRTIHLQPFYQKRFGFKRGSLPIAEYSSERLITLPLYPKMSNKDVRDVIRAVKKVMHHFKK